MLVLYVLPQHASTRSLHVQGVCMHTCYHYVSGSHVHTTGHMPTFGRQGQAYLLHPFGGTCCLLALSSIIGWQKTPLKSDMRSIRSEAGGRCSSDIGVLEHTLSRNRGMILLLPAMLYALMLLWVVPAAGGGLGRVGKPCGVKVGVKVYTCVWFASLVVCFQSQVPQAHDIWSRCLSPWLQEHDAQRPCGWTMR